MKKKKGLHRFRKRFTLLIGGVLLFVVALSFIFVGYVVAPEADPLETANMIYKQWTGELASARTRWNERPFEDYRFTYQEQGVDGNCIYTFEVRADEPAFIRNNDDHCGESTYTIDAIFDEIAQSQAEPGCFGLCECAGYWMMHADYDAEWGYPYNILWRDTGNAGFEPLQCPVPENRPPVLPNGVLDVVPLEG